MTFRDRKTGFLGLRLSPAERELAERLACLDEVPLSDAIRRAIRLTARARGLLPPKPTKTEESSQS